ncbi:cytosolic phospholipase A2 gamma isoform X2 [Mastacembelus armatus]|uniref:cytosolic phospholipase A2 gamma isoform X2 n=1 Tax=Mastacembelus armatus TaxID=205130 RepID=UPI000E463004|nr:cytosolic phospholipase A2 gamma isoform X2 [Mastacembelus armatus]
MLTGKEYLSVFLLFFWLVFADSLAKSVDNMEGNEAASENVIRQSRSLCAGEQEYVVRRKLVVLESLNSLGISCTEDAVPHIALLASGGGQRAAVALIGFLYQMEKEGLLDTLLYLGGVSGSTWSMSSLYSDPDWSTNMDKAVSRLTGPAVGLEEALAWLSEKSKKEYFSLSDVWGVLTSTAVMRQIDLRHFSDEARRNSTNPYPIYSAIEKHCFSNGPTEGKWFEVSPHEAGFPEIGLFVKTSHLGSRFQSGELLEQKPEMDMVELQGVLGCALAHGDMIKQFIPPWLNVPEYTDSAAEEYLRVYNALVKLVDLTRNLIKQPTAVSDLDKLEKILQDMVNCNKSELLESKDPDGRKGLFQQWSLDLLGAVETWSETLEDGTFTTHGQFFLLVKRVLPLIINWEWGTTSNFLYQYPDRFHLIDAGIMINVAYPSFLGDKRDIDLIIAPEYSAGNMFETLTLARDYAVSMKKPFPEIDNKILEERDWPKNCYVFEGKAKEPTIVYLPLFNRQNCKDEEEFKAKMEEYSTFQRPFSQEKIDFVLETAKANMKNNNETLLREINRAIHRRQNKLQG